MPSLPNRVGTPPPRALELELRRALAPMVEQARATVAAGRVQTQEDARRLGLALRKAWPDSRLQAIVVKLGAKAEALASKGWGPLERAKAKAAAKRDDRRDGADYDGEALVERWSKEAAKLISSVRDEVAEGLRRDVVAALKAGTDPAELAARWKASGIPVEFGTLAGRVKVIAQHQLATLHAEVGRARAEALGVTEFVWKSQGDSKVRPRHRELDGRIFTYKKPPADEGLPGTPVNCRCYAESVISDALLGSLGITAIIER